MYTMQSTYFLEFVYLKFNKYYYNIQKYLTFIFKDIIYKYKSKHLMLIICIITPKINRTILDSKISYHYNYLIIYYTYININRELT